jgi:hypothetical protein
MPPAPRQFRAGTRKVAGVTVRIALEVILVLRLGLPEITSRRQFRHHLTGPQASTSAMVSQATCAVPGWCKTSPTGSWRRCRPWRSRA